MGRLRLLHANSGRRTLRYRRNRLVGENVINL